MPAVWVMKTTDGDGPLRPTYDAEEACYAMNAIKPMRFVLPFFALVVLAGCAESPTEADGELEMIFSFEESREGWEGSFADYPTSKTAADLELVFDRRPLPEDIGAEGEALFLAGLNQSDDLFMFLKRRLDGLEPNTTYAITFTLEVASNAPSGCVGIGGAPGESVFMKAGAARVEPEAVVEGDDYRLNIDKGNQASGGENAVPIGHIANGAEQCTGDVPYRMITLTNRDAPFVIATDNAGVLWLLVGTDSGFEGKTALYYDTIEVRLTPQ